MYGNVSVGEPGAKKETLLPCSVFCVAVLIACYLRLLENINLSTIQLSLSVEFFLKFTPTRRGRLFRGEIRRNNNCATTNNR